VVGVEPNGKTDVVVGIETLSGATENVPGTVQAIVRIEINEEQSRTFEFSSATFDGPVGEGFDEGRFTASQ